MKEPKIFGLTPPVPENVFYTQNARNRNTEQWQLHFMVAGVGTLFYGFLFTTHQSVVHAFDLVRTACRRTNAFRDEISEQRT